MYPLLFRQQLSSAFASPLHYRHKDVGRGESLLRVIFFPTGKTLRALHVGTLANLGISLTVTVSGFSPANHVGDRGREMLFCCDYLVLPGTSQSVLGSRASKSGNSLRKPLGGVIWSFMLRRMEMHQKHDQRAASIRSSRHCSHLDDRPAAGQHHTPDQYRRLAWDLGVPLGPCVLL
jgi:hypothetical protein